jgi:hypothetical protein
MQTQILKSLSSLKIRPNQTSANPLIALPDAFRFKPGQSSVERPIEPVSARGTLVTIVGVFRTPDPPPPTVPSTSNGLNGLNPSNNNCHLQPLPSTSHAANSAREYFQLTGIIFRLPFQLFQLIPQLRRRQPPPHRSIRPSASSAVAG